MLKLSPPLNMEAHWFAPHVAYTMAKFGMSMCVLGMAGRVRSRTDRGQRAVAAHHDRDRRDQNLLGGEAMMRAAASPRSWAMPRT